MSSLVLGGSAGAVAFLYYLQHKRKSSATDVPVPQEAPSRWSHEPPNTKFETLVFCKDVFSFMLRETVGRWRTMDLFVGLAYLSHRHMPGYPASDIAEKGTPLSVDPTPERASSLMAELDEIRHYMMYCRGLKHTRPDLQRRFWVENLKIKPEQIIRHEDKAGMLRPAYVLIRDEKVRALVLCIRGTQGMKDLFTSLTGTAKPHHMVAEHGVILGYSHQGMLTAARGILRRLVPPQGPSPLLAALADAGPGYGLRVIGHSMGGGTAVMLTMMLREHEAFANAQCVALACPACMTLELARSCKDYVTTVVNGTDIVPTFCSASVDALREDVTASSWFLEFQRDLRTSVTEAWEGSMHGMGNASRWTSRNILQPVFLPFRSCYSLSSNTARTSCGRLGIVRMSEDEMLVATGMDELLLGGLQYKDDGCNDGSAPTIFTPPSPAQQQLHGLQLLAPALSIPSGLHSHRSSQVTLQDWQQQDQLLPNSPLSEEAIAETLYSCLYAGHMEAGTKPGRRRAGRGGVSGTPTDLRELDAGKSKQKHQGDASAVGMDAGQALALVEEAQLGSESEQGGYGEGHGVQGNESSTSGIGSEMRGPDGRGGKAWLPPITALRQRLWLWGGAQQPQDAQQQLQQTSLQGELQQPLLPQHNASPSQYSTAQQQQELQVPRLAKLLTAHSGWSMAQRAAVSAGSWLWESMAAQGRRGGGGEGLGDVGLETLADNGAGASLMLSAGAPAKPSSPLCRKPWQGENARRSQRGLRPRRQMLGRLREQLLSKSGFLQGAQPGSGWKLQQQQQEQQGAESQMYADADEEGSEGSQEEEDEDELEIGVDFAEELFGREGGAEQHEPGRRERRSADGARQQVQAGITAVVAAVTIESSQRENRNEEEEGDKQDEEELQGPSSSAGHACVTQAHQGPAASGGKAAPGQAGFGSSTNQFWNEGEHMAQGVKERGALRVHSGGGYMDSKEMGGLEGEDDEVCAGVEEGLGASGRSHGPGKEATGPSSSGSRSEATSPGASQPVYAPKRLYPAGRVLHFFPLSVLPGYEQQKAQEGVGTDKQQGQQQASCGQGQQQQEQQKGEDPVPGAQNKTACPDNSGKDVSLAGSGTPAANGGVPSNSDPGNSSSLFHELGGSAAWDAGTATAACAEDPVAAAVAAAAAAAVGSKKDSDGRGGRAARTPGPAARDESGLLLAAVAPAPQPWVLMEVSNHEAYGRVKLCKRMVVDHFVYSYLQALDSVVLQLKSCVGGKGKVSEVGKC